MRHDGFYIVALSGGADSVALLHVLKSLGYRVSAVHCNFHLRGEESVRDENFCVSLCAEMQVTLHRAHFDTKSYAELHGVSIEMAARTLRYRYFEQLRHDVGADGICVAHHRDDQVETVLLNLVRGTGLSGLRGMYPRNGYVLRPMLGVARAEVLDYLRELGQPYVTDSTNLVADVQRNRLRLDIIPQLEELNPAVKDNILRMTENLAEVEKLVGAATAEATMSVRLADGSIGLDRLARQPSPLYLLWSMLSPYGFKRSQVVEMVSGARSGAQWSSVSHVAHVDRARLYILNRKACEQPLPVLRVPETGTYVYAMPVFGEGKATLGDGDTALREKVSASVSDELKFRFATHTIGPDFQICKSATAATLDAAKVRFPLTLRPVQEGDRFVPFGMKGTKLVSDFLADAKLPLPQRLRQLVLCDADGSIVWLVGQRIDARYGIRFGESRKALMVEMV